MQPAGVFVPEAQLYVTEPPDEPMVHAPVQVMEQLPAVHATREFAPTVAVHDLPEQVSSQSAPHVPLHVEFAAQLN